MPSRIPLEALAALPSFYFAQPSWDGTQVGFYGDKSGRLELYVLDIPSSAVTQISHGELPRAVRAGFVWDRRDETIIFARACDSPKNGAMKNVSTAACQPR